VFDGAKGAPYVESDATNPLGVYGRSKLDAETRVLDADPQALVIRTSAFFGPWDRHNFVTQALGALANGEPFQAAGDMIVSPTYVPDLVKVALDLMIDRERGIWHLTNGDAVSWAELARRACAAAGMSADGLQEVAAEAVDYPAQRPAFSALGSERARLLPSLDDALQRYAHAVQEAAGGAGIRQAGEATHYAR
jgi:dTDP-4-dehydrorhamnose reductase